MDWLVEEWNAPFLFRHLDLEERFVIYLCATYELSVWRWLPVSFWSLRSCRHVTLEIYYNFSCLYCAMHVSTSSRERERLFVSLFWNYTTTRTRPRPTACLGTCLFLNRRWTLSLSLNDVLAELQHFIPFIMNYIINVKCAFSLEVGGDSIAYFVGLKIKSEIKGKQMEYSSANVCAF